MYHYSNGAISGKVICENVIKILENVNQSHTRESTMSPMSQHGTTKSHSKLILFSPPPEGYVLSFVFFVSLSVCEVGNSRSNEQIFLFQIKKNILNFHMVQF